MRPKASLVSQPKASATDRPVPSGRLTLFRSAIPTSMLQGGGFEPGMREKKTRPSIKNESDNGLSNDRGTLAMARTPDPQSATAQFFINVRDNKFLDKAQSRDRFGYCVFGKVTEGMDVVDKIKDVHSEKLRVRRQHKCL